MRPKIRICAKKGLPKALCGCKRLAGGGGWKGLGRPSRCLEGGLRQAQFARQHRHMCVPKTVVASSLPGKVGAPPHPPHAEESLRGHFRSNMYVVVRFRAPLAGGGGGAPEH